MVAPDYHRPLPGVAGEEGGAVVHLGDAAAYGRAVVHLRGHVGEEEHLAVAGAGDQRQLFTLVHDLEARVAHAVLAAVRKHEHALPIRADVDDPEVGALESIVGGQALLVRTRASLRADPGPSTRRQGHCRDPAW